MKTNQSERERGGNEKVITKHRRDYASSLTQEYLRVIIIMEISYNFTHIHTHTKPLKFYNVTVQTRNSK